MVDGRSSEDAHTRITIHEQVCAERYQNLLDHLKRIEDAQISERAQRLSAETMQTAQYTAISNRMWGVLVGTTGASVMGMAAILMYEITKGRL